MTYEGLSRVEVALEDDDEDLGELSRLAPGRCESCLSQIQDLKTVQLLLFPS